MLMHRASWQLWIAAASLAAAGSAQAVDYFRIDVGASASTDAGIRGKDFASDGVICGDPLCASGGTIDKVGTSALLSGGLGWRIGSDWRADLTLGYRGWYKMDQTMPDSAVAKGDISSLSLMLAGYRDFSFDWGRPYLGAGIGAAQNETDEVKYLLGGFTFDVPGGSKTGAAWAVMAGIGFPLSPTKTLDIGYRYADLGKLVSGSGSLMVSGVPVGPYSGFEGRLKAHELSVGLRF
jgi:opacity protein-like surface antigen